MTLLQVLLMFPYLKYAIKLKQEKLVAFMHLWLWWSTCFHVKANNSLRPGDTLNYTETGKVITKNGKYFLAFYTIVDDTYLAVWKTNWDTYWVWLSDRNQPVDPDSAVLSLNHSGVLKIESQRGKPIILYSPPQPINNTVATLLDTGNFVLQQLHPNGSTMSVLWQSFDYPIDTMIPTMKLGVNHKTGHNWSLVSYFANDDINIVTPGAFSLEWEPVGEELVIRRRGKVSWRSGKLRNNRFEHISEDAQRTLNYTVVSNADESSFSFTTTNDDVDVLWWIASDGQLNNYSETVVWADMCYGYNTDEGCQRWEDIPECRSRGDVYQRKTGHLNFEYAISEPNMSYGLSDCQAMCWSNCSCTGYKEHNHNGTGCTFFSSGPYYTLSDVGERFYMLGNVTQQIDKSTAKSEPPGTKKFIWISALIATILLIICLFSVCLILKKRKYMFQDKKKKGMVTKMLHLATCKGTSSRKEFEDDLKHGLELKAFTYISIMEATDGFSSENKLGQGGFGPVYKGIFSTGQEVAIKRLSKSSTQGIVEFKNELKLICELQHMNLVQLLGYCIHEEERILLYEYMPNKSLDFFIFDCTRRKLLDWKKRFNIIEGIAQGLLYLHKYSRLKVIHRDLKASNILLDENWNPKISDFGMARIFTQQEPVENTNRVVGTYGYMSPEYAMEGIFSTKSDVYSFGVLLLEIISGRRNTSFYDDDHPLNLIGHAWELWNVGEPLQLVDQSLNESFEPDEVQRCIHVGLLCVEQYTNDRPTMFDILSMLTNKSAIVSLPQRPAFYVKREISNRSLSSKELLTDSTFEITTSGKMESRLRTYLAN